MTQAKAEVSLFDIIGNPSISSLYEKVAMTSKLVPSALFD